MTQTPEHLPQKRYADNEPQSAGEVEVGTDTTPTTDPTAELTPDSPELTGDDS
jgi:hypothetical protein